MLFKVKFLINLNNWTLDVYIENKETKEDILIDTWIELDDEIKINNLKKTYEYIGCEVEVQKYIPED